MTTEITMTCRVQNDEGFNFLATTHEGTDGSITIHGDLPVAICCSVDQAGRLIEKLQAAINTILAYGKVA